MYLSSVSLQTGKKTENDMQGMNELLFSCYVILIGKQLMILKFSSSVVVLVVEGNDFRRPILQDNMSCSELSCR